MMRLQKVGAFVEACGTKWPVHSARFAIVIAGAAARRRAQPSPRTRRLQPTASSFLLGATFCKSTRIQLASLESSAAPAGLPSTLAWTASLATFGYASALFLETSTSVLPVTCGSRRRVAGTPSQIGSRGMRSRCRSLHGIRTSGAGVRARPRIIQRARGQGADVSWLGWACLQWARRVLKD